MSFVQTLGTQQPSADREVSGQSELETIGALVWDLIAANRILAQHNVLDGYGHVSARNPSNPNRYFISTSMAPEAVTPRDLIELDLDSNPTVEKHRPMHLERFIHGAIYHARPDVQAVVHFHAPPAVLMSVSGEPLRPIYHMAAFIGEGVPVFEIRDVAGMTDMLISNLTLGSALAQVLGDKPAVLLRGHGAVVVGKDIPEAAGRAMYLTVNAHLQSQSLGRNIEFLAPEEARLASRTLGAYPKSWGLWKAKVMSELR